MVGVCSFLSTARRQRGALDLLRGSCQRSRVGVHRCERSFPEHRLRAGRPVQVQRLNVPSWSKLVTMISSFAVSVGAMAVAMFCVAMEEDAAKKISCALAALNSTAPAACPSFTRAVDRTLTSYVAP